MKKSKPEPVPVMDYRQYRRARRLVHECCNYDGGHCIALDDGEECVCVQSISYSLLCRWFRAAVLPLDREELANHLVKIGCTVIIMMPNKAREFAIWEGMISKNDTSTAVYWPLWDV